MLAPSAPPVHGFVRMTYAQYATPVDEDLAIIFNWNEQPAGPKKVITSVPMLFKNPHVEVRQVKGDSFQVASLIRSYEEKEAAAIYLFLNPIELENVLDLVTHLNVLFLSVEPEDTKGMYRFPPFEEHFNHRITKLSQDLPFYCYQS